MRKKIFLFSVFIVLHLISLCQNNIENPRAIPPSPEAANLGKYAQIPVGLFTGTPEISIPIYDIDLNRFKLPIGLSYHASGIKVNEIASWVGLGWVLNAGGIISRQINGIPDEDQNGILNTGIPRSSAVDYTYYNRLYHSVNLQEAFQTDLERDEFNYNFLGHTGKFVFDTNGEVVLIPFDDIKIEFIDRLYFKVTDPEGNIYIFNNKEQSDYYGTYSDQLFDIPQYRFSGTTSWQISEIIPINGIGSIKFYYTKTSTGLIRNFNYTALICFDPVGPAADLNNKGRVYNSSEQLYLNRIDFPSGHLAFDCESSRLDDPNGEGKILKKVSIFSNQSTTPVKTIIFNQDYLFSDKGVNVDAYITDKYRLRLNNVIEQDASGNNVKRYSMEYNPLLLPPRKNCGIDLWGFYNGAETNETLVYYDNGVPSGNNTTRVDYLGQSYYIMTGNRAPNEAASQACMLKRLYYPTGGYSEFEFEAHKFMRTSVFMGGGLRIKKISNINVAGDTASVKLYKYGENENGIGQLSFLSSFIDRNSYVQNYVKGACIYDYMGHCTTCLETPFQRLHIQDRPVYNLSQINGSCLVGYSQVTEYEKSFNGVNGKKVYYYDATMDDFTEDMSNQYPFGNRFVDLSWKRGLLLKEEVYKKSGVNFIPVKKTTNIYDTFHPKNLIGLYVGNKIQRTGPCKASSNPLNLLDQEFYYFEYPIVSGIKKLTQTIDSLYYDGNILRQITNIEYGQISSSSNPHGFVTKTTQINSKGNNIITINKYPSDISNGIYPTMVNKNMIDYVVEKVNLVDNSFTSGKLTPFRLDDGNYVPDMTYSLETTTPFTSFNYFNGTTKDSHYSSTPEITFDDYDTKGNLLQTTGRDGIVTSYLWDATGRYPLAEVKGATYAQISSQNGQVANYSSLTLYNSLNSLVPSAHILTYSYTPLVGMTSSTDPKGVTTWYEYDNFGRLKCIKDDDQKILKQFDYRYYTDPLPITPLFVGTPAFALGASSARCQGAGTVTYSATAANSTGISYSLDATSIAGGNSIVATTGAVTYAAGWSGTSVITASASGLNGPATATHTVTTNQTPGAAGTISGTASVTQGQTGVTYSLPAISGATGYVWSLPSGATITSGANTNSILVNYSTSASSGNINVTGTNDCGSGAVSSNFAVSVGSCLPAAAGTISGTASVCKGTSYSYSVPAIANATSYVWSLPSGASIVSGANTNSITVNYSSSASSGSLSVYGANSCGSGTSSSFAVTVNSMPAAAGTISGTASVCKGTSYSYSVPAIANATSYVWSLPSGASIVSGANTNSITVNYSSSASSGSLSVYGANSCGSGTSSSYSVTVNSPPAAAGTISGSASVTQGQTGVAYSVPAISGAAGYVWNLPYGATIISGADTNSITVNYSTSASSGNINVTGTNDCGSGAASSNFAVSVGSCLPAAAGTISGSASICLGQSGVSYSVPTIANATGYAWTLPGGATIISGANTRSITVNYSSSASSGSLSVCGTNSCGSGTSSSYAVTVNSMPAAAGTISGSASVCQGAASVSYSVPAIANATSYVWSLPSGASIVSGANTRSITVNYSSSASSGSLSVYGTNSCGSGTSSSYSVTVNSLPAAAGAISGSATVCQGQLMVESYSVPTIANATGYVWTLPSGATIYSGANTNEITVSYSSSASSGNISVYGTNNCGSGTSSSHAVTVNPRPADAGTISGSASVNQGQTNVAYSVPAITGATSYGWGLPTGASITSGSNTNSITVDYSASASSGNIYVFGINDCGWGNLSTLPVTVNQVSSLSTDYTSLSFLKLPMTSYVAVSSNTSWTVTSYPSWIMLSATSGTGNVSLSVTPERLYSGSRTGSVVLATTDGTVSVTITISQGPL